MYRRRFLEFAGGLTIFPLIHEVSTSALAQNTFQETITLEGWDFQGNPLDESAWKSLYFLDLEENPIFTPPRQVETGKLVSSVPPFPAIIAIRLLVSGFGKVYLYADNQGKGYTITDFPLNLNLELARTRWYRVQYLINTWLLQGYSAPATVINRLHKARFYLQKAQKSLEIAEQVKWCQQSLYESLWVGEEAVLAHARNQIARQGKRPNFLFGCGFPYGGETEKTYFTELFNFTTLGLYWRNFEKNQGQKNYERINKLLDWLEQNQITPKGHPLVWFAEYGIPEWLEDISFNSMKGAIEAHIQEVTQYFGDRFPYYDIINEASGRAFANQPGYTSEELVELSRIAANACYQGNPQAFRIINTCCLWAQYRTLEQPSPYTPYQYIKACLGAKISFEAIGLQLYYPNHDLLEINRLLERFRGFGKLIHITELGVPSDTTEDENSWMKTPFGLWHNPWSETIQADWIEQFYTLCYSKPYIKAITWWELSDRKFHFWAHGGLLRPDGQPKESFYRLKTLLKQWQT